MIARKIRAARALAGWRQADLAEKSGISEVAIKKIEQGAVSPRPKTLDALKAALKKVGVTMTKDGVAKALPVERASR